MRTLPGQPKQLTFMSNMSQRFYATLNHFPFIPSDHLYNITTSKEKRFLWFRVAKVCTRTIVGHLDNHNIPLEAAHPHRVFYSPKYYQNYFRFAFVRNPWDRLVSCWLSKAIHLNRKGGRNRDIFAFYGKSPEELQKFEDFIDFISTLDLETSDAHFRLQCRLIDLNN
ncbi:MAG: sulfotransferase family 2 domain-containing protein, partial [Candidatus Parabeggiatoa sp.]|nr:sulfotransferase family 2 domain-containing protein [Candidatus Parabeggiatoa sp.]